jgi:hypothetical protein
LGYPYRANWTLYEAGEFNPTLRGAEEISMDTTDYTDTERLNLLEAYLKEANVHNTGNGERFFVEIEIPLTGGSAIYNMTANTLREAIDLLLMKERLNGAFRAQKPSPSE